MYIRLNPGGNFSDEIYGMPGLSCNGLMPLTISKHIIFTLRERFTPNQWYIYSVLMWYDFVKYEESTPTLEEIWSKDCSKMSKEEFDEALAGLLNLYVETKDRIQIPLIHFGKDK